MNTVCVPKRGGGEGEGEGQGGRSCAWVRMRQVEREATAAGYLSVPNLLRQTS